MLAAIEAAWDRTDPSPRLLGVSVTALAAVGYLATLDPVQTVLASLALLAATLLVLVGVTNLVRAAH